MELVILPVSVAMAWYDTYKHELLLGAAAQVRKFYYLCMRSSKRTVKTGPAKTRPAGPLATAMHATLLYIRELRLQHVVICMHMLISPIIFLTTLLSMQQIPKLGFHTLFFLYNTYIAQCRVLFFPFLTFLLLSGGGNTENGVKNNTQ